MSLGFPPTSSRSAARKRVRRGSGSAAKSNSSQCEPTQADLVAACTSLCNDQLKPYGRLLRKRLGELAEAAGVEAPDAELPRLRELCCACMQLNVQQESAADWSATVFGLPVCFVDIYSPQDYYGDEFWFEFFNYLENLPDGEMSCPGGRYVCAQGLVALNLPFMKGFSLGQMNHIVQLAMMQRKVLGYHDGAIVPYSRSQTMVKTLCAEQGCQRLNKPKKHIVATWGMLRDGVWQILYQTCASGKECFPLSNVKRVLQTDYKLDLSETALGHVSLSDLFQDSRLQDLCTVRLLENGYYVFPATLAFYPQACTFVQAMPMPSTCTPVQHTSITTTCASHRVPTAEQESVLWHAVPGPSMLESKAIFSTPPPVVKVLIGGPVNASVQPDEVPGGAKRAASASPSKIVEVSVGELNVQSSCSYSAPRSCPSGASCVFAAQDVFILPSTPRAMVDATPTPVMQRYSSFAEQLRIAVAPCDEGACTPEEHSSVNYSGTSTYSGISSGASSVGSCEDVFSLPSTPRAMVEATPTPFMQRRCDFTQQLRMAMELCNDDASSEDCRAGCVSDASDRAPSSSQMVKNTFIHFPSSPGLCVGAIQRAQSMPASPLPARGRFSHLVSEAVDLIDSDDDESEPVLDLPHSCRCEDELNKSATLFDFAKVAAGDAQTFTVKNTFISMQLPFSEFSIGSQARPQSLPATPLY